MILSESSKNIREACYPSGHNGKNNLEVSMPFGFEGGMGPSRAGPGQAEPSQAKPSQAKPSQAQPSQAKPSQARQGQATCWLAS